MLRSMDVDLFEFINPTIVEEGVLYMGIFSISQGHGDRFGNSQPYI